MNGDAWEAEWRERLDCWWLALPGPTRSSLGHCLGALSLHLASRLDGAWRAARGAARGGGGGAANGPPLAAAGAGGGSCEWVADTERLQLPQFPQFPQMSHFELPPLPKLLPPAWQSDMLRLQSSAPRGEWPVGPRMQAASDSALAHVVMGSSVGAGAALALAVGLLIVRGALGKRMQLRRLRRTSQ